MDLKEHTIASKTIFQGKIVELLVDQVRLPNGKQAAREVVRHPGGVTVLPLDETGNVTLVRQYRYPIGQELLELPAGKLDSRTEAHADAAARELSEETGLRAQEWTYLGSMLASAGFCDEELHLYLARGLIQEEQHPDEDEFLNVVTMSFDELARRVMEGEIRDAKTVAAVLKTKVLLGL